jgi:hypothetical protein
VYVSIDLGAEFAITMIFAPHVNSLYLCSQYFIDPLIDRVILVCGLGQIFVVYALKCLRRNTRALDKIMCSELRHDPHPVHA